MQRRLAAIVHADLAGFTRMMEGAETRTFRHLKSAQIEVWRPAIVAGGGRMVGTAGDAMLAEFGSAVGAVAASIDIQERMARFNEKLDEHHRMLFRIGVHLGEVIIDEEDQNIFGDGVNLAARIQAMAKPGSIAVSRSVRDMTELRIDYKFIDGGEHMMKNVSRPVHIYHVQLSKPADVPPQELAATPIASPKSPLTPTGATTFAPSAKTMDASARTTTKVLPQITLRFEGADSAGQKYSFNVELARLMAASNGMTIGRAADQCDFVVPHGTVSRRHARLTLSGEALQIEDLGSTNGTAVNARKLVSGTPAALQAGAKLKLGDVELSIRQA